MDIENLAKSSQTRSTLKSHDSSIRLQQSFKSRTKGYGQCQSPANLLAARAGTFFYFRERERLDFLEVLLVLLVIAFATFGQWSDFFALLFSLS